MWGETLALWILLALSSLTDLIWGKIFNWITLPAILIGLLFWYWRGGHEQITLPVLGIISAFAFFYPLYLLKAFAAADVKLLMAVGAWSSPRLVIQIGLLSVMIGAVVGAALLIRRYGLKGSLQSLFEHLTFRKHRVSYRMPFAPAFLCAFILLQIGEMQRWF